METKLKIAEEILDVLEIKLCEICSFNEATEETETREKVCSGCGSRYLIDNY